MENKLLEEQLKVANYFMMKYYEKYQNRLDIHLTYFDNIYNILKVDGMLPVRLLDELIFETNDKEFPFDIYFKWNYTNDKEYTLIAKIKGKSIEDWFESKEYSLESYIIEYCFEEIEMIDPFMIQKIIFDLIYRGLINRGEKYKWFENTIEIDGLQCGYTIKYYECMNEKLV